MYMFANILSLSLSHTHTHTHTHTHARARARAREDISTRYADAASVLLAILEIVSETRKSFIFFTVHHRAIHS